jgi:CO/xanthine dehydrogenase Mo-binding subunit
VIAVYTAKDTKGILKPLPCAWLIPKLGAHGGRVHRAREDTVRYVGDIVAVVVAATPYEGHDALELIEVDYEPLPVVVDPQQAAAPGAPQVHAAVPGNQAFHWVIGGGDVDAAFANADLVVKDRIIQQRLIPTAMEPRSALAQWQAASGELTLWNTTQNPHIVAFLCSVVAGVPENKLRVIAPEVGGGFGSKIAQYPGELHGGVLRHASAPAGQVDRDAQRELPSPPRTGATTCRRSRWRPPVMAVSPRSAEGLGRNGRLSLHRGARHSYIPARPDAVRPVSDPRSA